MLSNAIHLLLRTGGVPPRRSCVAATAGFRPADLLTPSKIPARVTHRRMLCYWRPGVGLSGTVVTGRLGRTQSAISRSVARGERLVAEKGASHLKRIIS